MAASIVGPKNVEQQLAANDRSISMSLLPNAVGSFGTNARKRRSCSSGFNARISLSISATVSAIRLDRSLPFGARRKQHRDSRTIGAVVRTVVLH